MNSKQTCGLLGRKLGHSYSPQIHGILADYSYELFQKEPEDVESFLKHGNWHGINVTIPYKKAVIPFLDELSPTAARLGAVNTVVRTRTENSSATTQITTVSALWSKKAD